MQNAPDEAASNYKQRFYPVLKENSIRLLFNFPRIVGKA